MPILFCSVKELKEKTPQVLRDVQGADIVVTVHGKPQAILRRFTEEQLGEAIARSEEIRKGLTAGIDDLQAKRTTKIVARHRRTSARRVARQT